LPPAPAAAPRAVLSRADWATIAITVRVSR